MPIGKLKSRLTQCHRSGVIRLGKKTTTQSGKLRPMDLHYFNLDDAPELKDFYGEEPSELDIIFTSDDEDLIAKTYLQMYKCENPSEQDPRKRRAYLACLGEGTDPKTGEPTMAYWYDKNQVPSGGLVEITPVFKLSIEAQVFDLRKKLNDTDTISESRAYMKKSVYAKEAILSGNIKPRWCCHENCSDFKSKNCKGVMTMSFKVPIGNVFGEYTLRTSSTYSMHNVLNCISDIKKTIKNLFPNHPYGKISGVPLKLKRVLTQIPYTSPEGQRKFSEHHILKMEVNPTFKDRFQKDLANNIAKILLDPPAANLLPAPELAGATPIDLEMPDDLYPTEEERRNAEEDDREKESQKGLKSKKNVETNGIDWVNTTMQQEEVIKAFSKLEETSGKKFTDGAKKAKLSQYLNKVEDFFTDIETAIRKATEQKPVAK